MEVIDKNEREEKERGGVRIRREEKQRKKDRNTSIGEKGSRRIIS